jgi:hypothetical protein
MKYIVTVPEDVARISRTYLPIQAAIFFFLDVCNQAPLILPKIQDQTALTLCRRSFSGCGWVRENVCFAHQGRWYIDNEPWSNNVNILLLTVADLPATINVKPETQNRRLEPPGLSQPGETRVLTGIGLYLARQVSAGRVFGLGSNRTEVFLRSKPGPPVGYPDPLLTLITGAPVCCKNDIFLF